MPDTALSALPAAGTIDADDLFYVVQDGASVKATTTQVGTAITALGLFGDALTTNTLAQFAATTSAQLRGVLSDETGTGSAVFATAPTLTNPIVGTQSPGDNSTKAASTAYVEAAVAAGGGGDALTANPLSQFAATTSAQLAGVISDETGSGALVFATSPTLVTPALGTPASGTLTNCTGLPSSGITSLPVLIQIAASDETTALTTGTAKVTFRAPYAFTLTAVRASVTTAPTGGTLLTVDINEGGSSVLSTKLTFDASEKTTTTAATAAVISDSAIADDAEITIDIDAVGSTIAGAGLKVTLIGTKP